MSENGGERELVLGNKQLLAIFFVAALLCGVFFAMGYVVGGNSAKTGTAANATETPSATVPEEHREQPKPQQSTDTVGAPSASGDAVSLPGTEPRVSDNPAAAGAQPPANANVSPSVAPSTISSAPPQSAPAGPTPRTPPAAAAAIVVSVPEKGAEYVQVSAPERPGADNLVKALRDAGLPSIMAESSKPKLFRVLVGPYRTGLAVADAKRKLKELGYEELVTFKQP